MDLRGKNKGALELGLVMAPWARIRIRVGLYG